MSVGKWQKINKNKIKMTGFKGPQTLTAIET